MTRLDHDVIWPTASAILGLVGHLLREEEQREMFAETVEALSAMLARRDELLARERKRLARPSEN